MMFTTSRLTERIFSKYTSLVIGHPVLVIFTTVLVSSFLTLWALYCNYSVIDLDPTKGFETRGTKLASSRLTMDAMKPHQTRNEHILRWYFEQNSSRRRRDLSENESTTIEPITVNYEDYGVDSEPNASDLTDHCEMFGAIGKSIPYDIIEYLGKIMVRVSNFDDLFDVGLLKHLCKVDSIIDDVIEEFNFTSNSVKALKHSLNIPLYTTCPNISTVNSCDSINANDVLNFKKLLETCKNDSKTDICSAFSINQVNNWLLPKGNADEFLVTVILRMTMWNGVDNREVYEELIRRLTEHFEENPKMRLVGVSLNLKDQLFQNRIRVDSVIATVSALLVFFFFLAYSRSLVFTLIILTVVTLSAGVAFFIYTQILAIDFFPFINLLVLVILISIGADDAFLLLVYFRREVEKMSNLEYKVGAIYVPLYRESDLHSRSLRLSLYHSLSSMFVTSLTTATTFLTNLTSPVIVLRCFGIYAAITVLVNYVLVLLILPGAIILTRPVKKTIETEESNDQTRIEEKITEFTSYFRFAIVLLSLILTGLSIFIIFHNPGLRIPKTNPTKLFVDSNIHEFYDNHLHHFNFPWQRSARLVENFIFGVEMTRDASSLSPYHRPGIKFTSNNYSLTTEKLKFYRNFIDSEVEKYKITNYTHVSWADKILRSKQSCISKNTKISNFCILSSSVEDHNLIHQFPDDFAVIPGDGPFINQDLQVVGYFVSIPTTQKLRIDADAIEDVFKEIENSCQSLKNQTSDPVICLSSSEITRFYDIVSQLRSSSFTSVVISIVICLLVIILCTRSIKLSVFSSVVILFVIVWTIACLILLGWKLSVVESTILIITIGLSFDYTLHYVVAIRDTNKVSSAHSTAGVASLFGSATLVLAGCPLLFAQTASFYQTGTMLFVLGITSLFGAAIVLPAFVITFARGSAFSSQQSTKL